MHGRDFSNKEQPHYYFFYEIDWEKNSTRSWGDIPLLEDCDGAALLKSTDGSEATTGFSPDILSGAPQDALTQKSDDLWVLGKTVGSDANFHATQWELSLLYPLTDAFIVKPASPSLSQRMGGGI